MKQYGGLLRCIVVQMDNASPHVGKQKDYRILLFKGAQSIELATGGLQLVEPVLILKEKPIEWAKLWEEITCF